MMASTREQLLDQLNEELLKGRRACIHLNRQIRKLRSVDAVIQARRDQGKKDMEAYVSGLSEKLLEFRSDMLYRIKTCVLEKKEELSRLQSEFEADVDSLMQLCSQTEKIVQFDFGLKTNVDHKQAQRLLALFRMMDHCLYDDIPVEELIRLEFSPTLAMESVCTSSFGQIITPENQLVENDHALDELMVERNSGIKTETCKPSIVERTEDKLTQTEPVVDENQNATKFSRSVSTQTNTSIPSSALSPEPLARNQTPSPPCVVGVPYQLPGTANNGISSCPGVSYQLAGVANHGISSCARTASPARVDCVYGVQSVVCAPPPGFIVCPPSQQQVPVCPTVNQYSSTNYPSYSLQPPVIQSPVSYAGFHSRSSTPDSLQECAAHVGDSRRFCISPILRPSRLDSVLARSRSVSPAVDSRVSTARTNTNAVTPDKLGAERSSSVANHNSPFSNVNSNSYAGYGGSDLHNKGTSVSAYPGDVPHHIFGNARPDVVPKVECSSLKQLVTDTNVEAIAGSTGTGKNSEGIAKENLLTAPADIGKIQMQSMIHRSESLSPSCFDKVESGVVGKDEKTRTTTAPITFDKKEILVIDDPLPNADLKLYKDGETFLENNNRIKTNKCVNAETKDKCIKSEGSVNSVDVDKEKCVKSEGSVNSVYIDKEKLLKSEGSVNSLDVDTENRIKSEGSVNSVDVCKEKLLKSEGSVNSVDVCKEKLLKSEGSVNSVDVCKEKLLKSEGSVNSVDVCKGKLLKSEGSVNSLDVDKENRIKSKCSVNSVDVDKELDVPCKDQSSESSIAKHERSLDDVDGSTDDEDVHDTYVGKKNNSSPESLKAGSVFVDSHSYSLQSWLKSLRSSEEGVKSPSLAPLRRPLRMPKVMRSKWNSTLKPDEDFMNEVAAVDAKSRMQERGSPETIIGKHEIVSNTKTADENRNVIKRAVDSNNIEVKAMENEHDSKTEVKRDHSTTEWHRTVTLKKTEAPVTKKIEAPVTHRTVTIKETKDSSKRDSPVLKPPKLKSVMVKIDNEETSDSQVPKTPKLRSVVVKVDNKDKSDSPVPKTPRLKSAVIKIDNEDKSDSPVPKTPRLKSAVIKIDNEDKSDSPVPKTPRLKSAVLKIDNEDKSDSPVSKTSRLKSAVIKIDNEDKSKSGFDNHSDGRSVINHDTHFMVDAECKEMGIAGTKNKQQDEDCSSLSTNCKGNSLKPCDKPIGAGKSVGVTQPELKTYSKIENTMGTDLTKAKIKREPISPKDVPSMSVSKDNTGRFSTFDNREDKIKCDQDLTKTKIKQEPITPKEVPSTSVSKDNAGRFSTFDNRDETVWEELETTPRQANGGKGQVKICTTDEKKEILRNQTSQLGKCVRNIIGNGEDHSRHRKDRSNHYRLGALQAHWLDHSTSPTNLKAKLLFEFGQDLFFAIGVTTNSEKQFIVTDTGNNLMKIFDPEGNLITEAGQDALPPLRRPSALVVDEADQIFVKDDFCIRAFSKEGQFLRNVGEHLFSRPYGLALTPAQNLLVLETEPHNPALVHLPKDGKKPQIFIYTPLLGAPATSKCRFLAVSNNNVIVSDLGLSQVYLSSLEGKFYQTIGFFGSGPGDFKQPSGVSVDNYGNVVIGDSRNNRVQMYRHDGTYVCMVDFDQAIVRPSGIHLTSDNKLLVVNYLQHKVKVYQL